MDEETEVQKEATKLAQGHIVHGRVGIWTWVSDSRAKIFLHVSRTFLAWVEISKLCERDIHCELWFWQNFI